MIEHRATCPEQTGRGKCNCMPDDDQAYGIWMATDFQEPTRYGSLLLVAALVVFVTMVTISVVSYMCAGMGP